MQDLGDLRQLFAAYSKPSLERSYDYDIIQVSLDKALYNVWQEIEVRARQHEAVGRYRDAELLYRRVSFSKSISPNSMDEVEDTNYLPSLVSIYEKMDDYPAAEIAQEKLLTQVFSKNWYHSLRFLEEQNRAVYVYVKMLSDFRQRVLDISSRLEIPVEKYTDLFITCRIAILDIPLLNKVSFEQSLINLEPNEDHYCTILHIAARQNAINLARLFIQKGAKIDSRDSDSCTPLHIAAKYAAPAMVELLLANNADVQAVDCRNSTPLHASLNGKPNLEVVAMLVYAKVDLNLVGGEEKGTALMTAIQYDRSTMALFLLEHRANVELYNDSGDTPLLTAIKYIREWAIKPLLEKGASLEARKWNGETALSVAVEKGQGSIVQILLDHGAMTKITVDQQNPKFETCLCRAVRVASVSIVETLLKAGADVNAGVYGHTALHEAVLKAKVSHEHIVHLLLSHSAPLDAVNKYGQTVFHVAVHNGRAGLISILIRHAEPDRLPIICGIEDGNGTTALAYAMDYAKDTKMDNERSIVHMLQSAMGLPHSSI